MDQKLPSIKILGTEITTASKEQILEYISKGIKQKTNKFFIVTPNPEILVYASRVSSFQNILNSAKVSLADGAGVMWADNIMKKEIKERVTGTDMMVELCRKASEQGFTVGFLGGRDGVAEMTAKCLQEKYPHLRVGFVGEEFPSSSRGPAGSFSLVRPSESSEQIHATGSHSSVVAPRKNAAHIDILFVAFGFPKQEEWIAKNLADLPVTAAMGVGGAFDYISGRVPRAPKVLQNFGMEWAFRLMVQPWRIKRQLALPVFVGKVLVEKFRKTQ